MIDRVNIDEIKAALAKATPGPWHDGVDRGQELVIADVFGDADEAVCDVIVGEGADAGRVDANAALIARAPEWLASLVAEVERLRREETAYDYAHSATVDLFERAALRVLEECNQARRQRDALLDAIESLMDAASGIRGEIDG